MNFQWISKLTYTLSFKSTSFVENDLPEKRKMLHFDLNMIERESKYWIWNLLWFQACGCFVPQYRNSFIDFLHFTQSQSNIEQKSKKITIFSLVYVWFPVCYQLVPKQRKRTDSKPSHPKCCELLERRKNLWKTIEWYRGESMTINVQCVRLCRCLS